MLSEYFNNFNKKYKVDDYNFNSGYFYTETVSDIYYITEEIESKDNKKITHLYGFVADFNQAKKLVKTLNSQTGSNRFDFNKVKLMEDRQISNILSGKNIFKKGNDRA